ncbi:hypothetical protein FBY58_0442 [Zymomonas mobilis]|uniref:Uncharacterized protein n=1 Tax=Zymomonas mobilis TaxID=542 RepID=A0A542VZY1_ZYMMB|nr:hypothetical protein [Zymomonas mobilis]TQL16892.1 hypothetical protein FBY58_0442 [Zymomonas mobilis]
MTASPAPYVPTQPDIYLVSGDGLVRNNMHVEDGRAGYLPSDTATSESQALLARGYARYYLASGDITALNNARKLADAALSYFCASKTPPANGLWYHHWVVNAGQVFNVKGPSNPNGHAYDGNVGEAITFTNGKTQLSAHLANVYNVFSGETSWQNVYADLSKGQFFDIDYFVDRDGYLFRWQSGYAADAVFTSDAEPQTAVPAGCLQMKNTALSGEYRVSYSVYTDDSIPYGRQFEGWPMWRHLMPDEQVMANDAIHWFIDLFYLMRAIDQDNSAKWESCYQGMLALWQTACVLTSSETHFFKRSVIGTYDSWPLTYFYAYAADDISYTPPTDYCRYGRDKTTGVAYFDLLKDAHRLGWVFQNDALNLGITSDLNLSIEAAVSQSANLTVILTDDQKRQYKYNFCPDTALASYSVPLQQFMDYTDVAEWVPGNTDFVYGKATATTERILTDEGKAVIACHYILSDSSAGIGFATAASNQKWDGAEPLVLSYITTSTDILLVVVDNAGWYWQLALPANADAALQSFAWGNFALAAYQTNTASLPTKPDISGALKTIQFQIPKTVTAPQNLYLVAAYNKMPAKIPDQAKIVSAAVSCSLADVVTIQIGGASIEKASTIYQPYFPGLLPFQHATIGSGRLPSGGGGLWQGSAYIGYQNPVPWMLLNRHEEACNMLQLMKDAQTHYATENTAALSGPFTSCYIFAQWDAEQYGAPYHFIFGGPDPNWGWGGFQYRAFHNVADYWARMMAASVVAKADGTAAEKATALAQDIACSFMDWLVNWLDSNPAALSLPSLFLSGQEPEADGDNPDQTALALKAALWCGQAGYDKAKAEEMVERLYSMLQNFQLSEGDMAGSYSPQPDSHRFYGFWMP